MVWQLLSKQKSELDWQVVGTSNSELFRLSYYFPDFDFDRFYGYGWIRQRLPSGEFASEWTSFYPKPETAEIYVIKLKPEVKKYVGGFFFREIQFRRVPRRGLDLIWTLEVEQWVAD